MENNMYQKMKRDTIYAATAVILGMGSCGIYTQYSKNQMKSSTPATLSAAPYPGLNLDSMLRPYINMFGSEAVNLAELIGLLTKPVAPAFAPGAFEVDTSYNVVGEIRAGFDNK